MSDKKDKNLKVVMGAVAGVVMGFGVVWADSLAIPESRHDNAGMSIAGHFNDVARVDYRELAIETYGVGVVAYVANSKMLSLEDASEEFLSRLDKEHEKDKIGSAWALSTAVVKGWGLDVDSLYTVNTQGSRGCDSICATEIMRNLGR